jgi:hypothetical protein
MHAVSSAKPAVSCDCRSFTSGESSAECKMRIADAIRRPRIRIGLVSTLCPHDSLRGSLLLGVQISPLVVMLRFCGAITVEIGLEPPHPRGVCLQELP